MWESAPITDWIAKEGRLFEDPVLLLEGLMGQLNCNGFAIARMRIALRALHPQVAVWSYTWDRKNGARLREVAHGLDESDAYIGSPIEEVELHGKPVRIRLSQINLADHHPVLTELSEIGLTDYYCTRVTFSGNRWCVLTIASEQPDGFDDGDIERFQQLLDQIGLVLEVHITKRIAHSLLDTYLGTRTGRRVINGQIRRGDGENIRAALWFSDVRDFTVLTETLSPDELLESLNVYFETIEAAVRDNGGEILRFIGDAMLIVFAQENGDTPASVCERAVAAAKEALSSLETKNAQRITDGQPPLTFGVGLHYGEVIYGNVGGEHRLDFTVMGVAVNRTARLESLTKQIGVPLLMSDLFADHIAEETVSCGEYGVKGVAEPLHVHALATDKA